MNSLNGPRTGDAPTIEIYGVLRAVRSLETLMEDLRNEGVPLDRVAVLARWGQYRSPTKPPRARVRSSAVAGGALGAAAGTLAAGLLLLGGFVGLASTGVGPTVAVLCGGGAFGGAVGVAAAGLRAFHTSLAASAGRVPVSATDVVVVVRPQTAAEARAARTVLRAYGAAHLAFIESWGDGRGGLRGHLQPSAGGDQEGVREGTGLWGSRGP